MVKVGDGNYSLLERSDIEKIVGFSLKKLVDPYGGQRCGSYACVFTDLDESVAVKVSHDKLDGVASFRWKELQDSPEEDYPGIVPIHGVTAITDVEFASDCGNNYELMVFVIQSKLLSPLDPESGGLETRAFYLVNRVAQIAGRQAIRELRSGKPKYPEEGYVAESKHAFKAYLLSHSYLEDSWPDETMPEHYWLDDIFTAINSMWRAGLITGDIHGYNWGLDENCQLQIVDLGNSRLPDEERERAFERLMVTNSRGFRKNPIAY